jgi:hypothetical protein
LRVPGFEQAHIASLPLPHEGAQVFPCCLVCLLPSILSLAHSLWGASLSHLLGSSAATITVVKDLMLPHLAVCLKEPRAAIYQEKDEHLINTIQQCMLKNARGNLKEVGKHGEVIERCSCT